MPALSTALTTIRRTPYQSLSLVITLIISLFVGYCLSFVLLGADIILKDLETKPQIIAFFELGTEQTVIDQLEKDLTENSSVKSVTVITQEEALKIYQEENQDDPLLMELVTAAILPASIEVQANTLAELQSLQTQLTAAEGVEDVVFPEAFIAEISKWMSALRSAGLVAVSIMSIQFFLTTFIAIGLKSTSQKNAISIARLLGASKGYVKRPFLVEGMIYGLLASILGWLLAVSTFLIVSPYLTPFGIPTLTMTQPSVLAIQLATGTVLTMMLGLMAGYLASSKLLRTH